MYGIDANIAQPPFSAIISILLVVACDYIGLYVIRKYLKTDVTYLKWIRWQAPTIGVALLSIIIYPMALIGVAHRSELRLIAMLMIAVSFVHIFKVVKSNFQPLIEYIYERKFNFIVRDSLSAVIVALVTGYALLALAPATSADTLDYHLGVPIEILNTGFIHATPEWFHSRLSGNGEALNALGLSVGAEQFGSLLQFIGLLSIVGLILRTEGQNNKDVLTEELDIVPLLVVLILSTPVIIFLIGSSKFQLLPISMTSLAFSLAIYPSRRNLSSGEAIKGFSLICILVMVASQAKLNYLLSGGVVGLITLILMFRMKLIWQSIVVGLSAALIIIVPVMVLKSELYGSGYFEALLSPLAGSSPELDLFENSLRGGRDSYIMFPFSLIIPSGIGTITTIIGIGVIFVLFLKPNHDKWLILAVMASIAVFVVTAVLGPKSSRSYLEPYFWILIVISLQNKNEMYAKYKKYLKPFVLMQSVAVIGMVWFGVATMFPGAISVSWRDDVMSRTANGYGLMKWVDDTLPLDAILLNGHRSMALAPRKAVSLDWLNYVEVGKNDASFYLERIKEHKTTHLLTFGETINQIRESNVFSGCLGDKVYGPYHGIVSTRNPFNIRQTENAWLVNFNSDLLPACFSSKFK
jgi:hypothetical protein